MAMVALIIFPILFFIEGFVFKLFRPYYRPIEFVLFNTVASVLALMLAFGSTLFYSMPYFIKMSLIHIGIYLIFAFVGLMTRKQPEEIFELFKEKFPMIGGISQAITMVALVSIMITLCFSIQFVITLFY